ncbi:hypothetical protein RJO15_07760 [Herbaspirillum huttiense F1]|uniref:hypothetical protein n=1 Tax=Herbaspirillum huttiense TaxID=863372 RepID=UPI002885D7C7|nr:hypothetical protein [Herbaspirillum huttiense]MDT0355655.1 hypothetical protein [Herbaspirillum huttiense F1]
MRTTQAQAVIARRYITQLRPLTVFVKTTDGKIYSKSFADDWYAFSHVPGNEIRPDLGWIEKRAA